MRIDLSIKGWCLVAALVLAGGPVQGANKGAGLGWHMEKLQLFVEESNLLYPDEFDARRAMLKEVQRQVDAIETLAPDPELEGDRKARAMAYLFQGIAELGLADTAKVRRSLDKALASWEAVELATPPVSAKQMRAQLDSLQLVPVVALGFSPSAPPPLHRLRWVAVEGEENEELAPTLADWQQLSLAYLAKKPGRRLQTIPVFPGRYRLESVSGEGDFFAPCIVEVSADGKVQTLEGGGVDEAMTLRRKLEVDLSFDPPEFAYLHLIDEETGQQIQGRGPGFRDGIDPEEIDNDIPPVQLGKYRIRSFAHEREVEDLTGRKIALVDTRSDSLRAQREGYEIYMVNKRQMDPIILTKVPFMARKLPRFAPAALVGVVLWLSFGNAGQLAR